MKRKAEPARIDARGLKCPWPVLRAARAMRDSQCIHLLADDPVAKVDIPALATAHGWALETTHGDSHSDYILTHSDKAADS